MKGKGVPKLRSNGRGDQLVIINLEIPTRLSTEQRQLFEELAKSLGSEVHPHRARLPGLAERNAGRVDRRISPHWAMENGNWLEVSLTVDGELAEPVAEVLARFHPRWRGHRKHGSHRQSGRL